MTIVIPNEIIQATGKKRATVATRTGNHYFRDYHISSAKAADFANLSLIEFRQEMPRGIFA